MNMAGASWPRGGRKRRVQVVVALASVASLAAPLAIGTTASAAPDAGVTSTTINVGVPYVDLSSLKVDGINIDQGSYPDAFNALVAQINAQGGINGRKIKLFLDPVNPTGTAANATVCTQLVQDDNVFAAMIPLQPECYQAAGVTVIGGTASANAEPAGAAPNFTPDPPPAAFDPLELAYFTKEGVFKGKKVALFGGDSADATEITIVEAALKKDHVDVVQSAVDSAPEGDLPASDQQITVIAQRFESDGANVVVGVGTGSAAWTQGLQAIQSTYAPRLVATSFNNLAGVVDSKGGDDPTYLKGALTADPVPSEQAEWQNPAMQKCIGVIKKAYPSTVIGSPVGASPTAPTTWVAAETACQSVALFEAVAKAAGKHLTAKSFESAGYGLRNVSIPGFSATTSFGPGRDYGLGPIYPVSYDTATQQLVISAKSVS